MEGQQGPKAGWALRVDTEVTQTVTASGSEEDRVRGQLSLQ